MKLMKLEESTAELLVILLINSTQACSLRQSKLHEQEGAHWHILKHLQTTRLLYGGRHRSEQVRVCAHVKDEFLQKNLGDRVTGKTLTQGARQETWLARTFEKVLASSHGPVFMCNSNGGGGFLFFVLVTIQRSDPIPTDIMHLQSNPIQSNPIRSVLQLIQSTN